MKKFLLPLLLLFSVNFAHAGDHGEGILLDAPVVNLGYLESLNGLPFNQTVTLIRTDLTPKMVDLYFTYTQIEMICADRVPDGGGFGYGGGGNGCNGGCCDNSCEPAPEPGCSGGGCGYEKSNEKYNSWGHGGYSYGGGYGNNGFDRNFMGICRRWTTMETQKSGRAKLVFKKGFHNDTGDIIKVMIHQRDLHSTVFWVKGWAADPNDYYKVINLERTVIFK